MRFVLPMLALVPVALVLEYGHIGGPTAVFLASALSLIPLAALLGRATEEAAIYTGPRIGALLNATLGNAAELIITIIALPRVWLIWSRRRSPGRLLGISSLFWVSPCCWEG